MVCYLLPLVLLFSCSEPDIQNENKNQNSPNVLFISVDDLRPELGCYGKDYIHSPNIDKLASEGIAFANHFVQVPTCGASRFSMLTGMLPRSKAHLGNDACRKFISGKPEADKPETFIHHLRHNGYYTVGIGKISHYADGLLYGYTDPVGEERELPHSWDELEFNAAKWGTGWNAFFGYANGENRQSMNRQVKPYEDAEVSDFGYPDGMTAALAVRKMKELAGKDQPFFLGVGFFKPHLPFNAPKKYWDLYNRENIPLSPNPYVPENINAASLHGSGEFNGYQLGEEKASLSETVSHDYARKVRHAYFACVSYIDAQIGKLIDELENLGISENTMVIIWGDHGWHLGDHNVWGKHTIFERALKSALIIKVPGTTNGKTITKVVSTIDLYPTIVELCGLSMPHQTDGRSILPLIQTPLQPWQEATYGYYRNGISVRDDRYRLTKYFRSSEPIIELYDHIADPFETINIASERPDIVEKMLLLLDQGDTGLYN